MSRKPGGEAICWIIRGNATRMVIRGMRKGPQASKLEGAMDMAKKNSATGVYRVTEIIGTSKDSWEAAAKSAVETAAAMAAESSIPAPSLS